MLKSLSESLRSLWQPKTNEAVQRANRKRKRPTNEGDQEDSDVEVVSVKIQKKDLPESRPGLLSFFTVPMSKMSEWVRKKTVRQDHFFVRPVPADSHWHQERRGQGEPESRRYNSDQRGSRNGPLAYDCLQDCDRFSRQPVRSRNGAHENGISAERGSREQHVGAFNSSLASSRRSSCSSSKAGTETQGTVNKCFNLKEREEYLKLLQQFTTVNLGYHGSKNQRKHLPDVPVDESLSRRKPGQHIPVLGATPTTTSSSSSSPLQLQTTFTPKPEHSQPSARFRVTPSRYLPPSASLLPSGTTVERPTSSSSSSLSDSMPLNLEHFALPRRPGRALPVDSAPRMPGRLQQRRSLVLPGRGGTSLKETSPASSIDHDIKATSDSEVEERLKASNDVDVDRQRKVRRDSAEQRLKLTPEDKEVLWIKDSPVSDADQRPVVDEHKANLVTQSHPGLNFKSSEYLDDGWLNKLNEKYASLEMERQRLITEADVKKKLLEERREARSSNLGKKLEQQLRLFNEEPEVIEELPLPEVQQEKPLPELTEAMLKEVRSALANGNPGQVLSEGFRLQLTRADLATLRGLNWLNDEVINFYMNMLMGRGEQQGFEKAYAFNTFFYPKLLSGGHDAVKRWTRRVDVFAHSYLIIPVHLGVHWCLCMVFIKDKKICYYDSMGGNNNQCLNAVRQYLADESMQKRNVRLDLSEWTSEIVKDLPQQMNGSDCGMFACMYAETLTRGDNITFTQKDMPYFRQRMVYEILKKKLL
ncbi:hypothetical protein ACOMHN_001218 [Nucella lapillus]